MVEVFNKLNDEQLEFISDEFDIELSDDMFASKSEEELDELYNSLCDIEVHETVIATDDNLSRRGEIASSIVTVVGNAIAEKEGYLSREYN